MNKKFLMLILGVIVLLLFSFNLASAQINVDWIYPTVNINVSQNQFFNITANISCTGTCGEINVTLDPAALVYNFTTCGVTGKTGPSLANCTSNYSGTNLAGTVGVVNGIQNWTVPYTGIYTIEAVGAKGGGGGGGKGTSMKGNFQLTKGQVIKILVGQRGTKGSGSAGSNNSGGGGGGSFVAASNNSLYIVGAGGGGGNGDYGSSFPNNPTGNPGNTGTSGSSTYGGGGGTNGGGGNSWVTDGQAAGGGGYNGSGTVGSSSSGGGSSFLANGTGGAGGTGSYFGGDGGFGGGGGGSSNVLVRGGGGGGYSGGQGGTYAYSSPTVYPSSEAIDRGYGGGGGSYNIGENQNNTASYNYGEGYVSITFTGGAKSGTLSTTIGDIPYYTNVTNPYILVVNDGETKSLTWTVNATGVIDIPSEFFIYANLSSNMSINNQSSKLNITIKDTTLPLVNILYPSNTNYNIEINQLNYSYYDINSGYCWYSTNNGQTNSSAFSAGTNFTNLTSVDGSNTWIVYCWAVK